MKTHDFRVDRETRYNKNKETYEFIGYNSRHDLSLEIPLDNALIHQILLEIVKLDYKIDFSIHFRVKDRESAMQQLIVLAINNASEKAKIIAASSGVELMEIININYAFTDVFIQSNLNVNYSSDSMMCADAAPDITPSDIDLSENITITWKIQ